MVKQNNFREISPIRTCTKKYASYRSYKPYLAKDFHNKCGYSNCSDFWFGGSNCFHIDHFKPKNSNPELETEYNNLIYCCSYVNILKSDDNNGLYIDPCDVDYNMHFERQPNGAIIPLTDEAKYMYSKMKLYLDRYRIIWQLDQLNSKIKKLESMLDNNNDERIENIQNKLLKEFWKYVNYLKG